ncbi:MAG: DNA polymerase Y family protein [Acidobacteriia bacterium]|nr:DNA polymerase Y family protein [Terriglobia bacterium]
MQAGLRAETAFSYRSDAVAVLDGPESLLKVFACNAPARRAGVIVGMTKAQAEVSPHVVLRKRAVEQERAANDALLECGYSFSPRIESTCPGTVIVDLTGAERLLGTAEKIGRRLAARAAACGLMVNVGLAGNPDSALHAARGFTGITVVLPGQEASCLSRLPVEVLQPDAEILDTLDSWGIRDFKSLAALPEIPLTQRLGQYGLHLQRLAKGEVRRELVPAELPQVFQESMELEEPVDLLEPLAFVLNRLLEQLMARLLERSLATDHARVVLELEIHHDRQVKADDLQELPSPMHERTLKLPAPTQDTKILLKLLQLDLEANPPQGPVKKVTVEVFAARLRLGQAGLFQPLTPEPAKLEITLARLRAVVGNEDEDGRGCVGFPQMLDSHKPDSFQMLPSMPERSLRKNSRAKKQMHRSFDSPSLVLGLAQDDRAQRSSDDKTPRLAMRRFRPPLAAIVEMAGDAPRTISFSGMRTKVRNASGPWRVSGSWWDQAEQWQRDEWDVEISTEGGMALYRMFREVRSGQWYVEGMYD